MLTKNEYRQHFKALRERWPEPDRLLASDQICRHLEAFCSAHRIGQVGAFWPLGSEVDLRPLVASHPHLGFWFPRILGLEPPRLGWGPQPLAPGAWGLMEPISAPQSLPPVQLLLVPGLAFAADGQRLGYGKGFYDAVLDQLPAEVLTLGVGFGFQHCPELPSGPQDRPVRGRVDESGIRWISPI